MKKNCKIIAQKLNCGNQTGLAGTLEKGQLFDFEGQKVELVNRENQIFFLVKFLDGHTKVVDCHDLIPLKPTSSKFHFGDAIAPYGDTINTAIVRFVFKDKYYVCPLYIIEYDDSSLITISEADMIDISLLQTELRLAALHLAAHLSAIPENPIQNFQQKIWKDGFDSVSLRQLDNIITDIQNGTIEYIYRRRRKVYDGNYDQSDLETVALGASVIVGGGSKYRSSASEQYDVERTGQRRDLLIQWAKLKGFWYDDIYGYLAANGFRHLDEKKKGGNESEVFGNGKVVVKINNPDILYPGNLTNAINRFLIHNYLFGGNLPIYILGFTMIDGYLRIVATQPFVRAKHTANKGEIKDFVLATIPDAKTEDEYCNFHTDDFIIHDLHQLNVLKDDDGNLYVIDSFLKFNNNELQGFFNKDTLQKIDTESIYRARYYFSARHILPGGKYSRTYHTEDIRVFDLYKLIMEKRFICILRPVEMIDGEYYCPKGDDFDIVVDAPEFDATFAHIHLNTLLQVEAQLAKKQSKFQIGDYVCINGDLAHIRKVERVREKANGNGFEYLLSNMLSDTYYIDEKELSKVNVSLAGATPDSPYSGNGGRKDTTERGILDEYYTPDFVCEFMYALAVKYGYKAGKVLEPSCATGNIIRPIYERNDYTHIDAFEINKTSRDICQKLFPNVTIYDNYFETAFLEPPRYSTKAKRPWLKNAPYDLAIGNPPYGKHVNRYSSYFSGKDKFAQIEMFFMYKCLDLLRSGGLLVFITSTNFMSTGNAYQGAKERIGEIADLVDAYRLPKVFERTDICTDIIVLRKK